MLNPCADGRCKGFKLPGVLNYRCVVCATRSELVMALSYVMGHEQRLRDTIGDLDKRVRSLEMESQRHSRCRGSS